MLHIDITSVARRRFLPANAFDVDSVVALLRKKNRYVALLKIIKHGPRAASSVVAAYQPMHTASISDINGSANVIVSAGTLKASIRVNNARRKDAVDKNDAS